MIRLRRPKRVPMFNEWIGTKTKHPSRRFRSGNDAKPLTYFKGGRARLAACRIKAMLADIRSGKKVYRGRA